MLNEKLSHVRKKYNHKPKLSTLGWVQHVGARGSKSQARNKTKQKSRMGMMGPGGSGVGGHP